jgi:hypothetical protein
MPDETIWIVTADTSDESPDAPGSDGAKNGGHIGVDWSDAWDAQPNEPTQKQAAKAVDQMFTRADAEADMKSIELSEIDLSVAINAEGSFSLVGLGAKVADTRTVLLRFKRKS